VLWYGFQVRVSPQSQHRIRDHIIIPRPMIRIRRPAALFSWGLPSQPRPRNASVMARRWRARDALGCAVSPDRKLFSDPAESIQCVLPPGLLPEIIESHRHRDPRRFRPRPPTLTRTTCRASHLCVVFDVSIGHRECAHNRPGGPHIDEGAAAATFVTHLSRPCRAQILELSLPHGSLPS